MTMHPLLRLLLAAVSTAVVSGQVPLAEQGTKFLLMFTQNIVDMPQDRPVEIFVQNDDVTSASVSIELPIYVSDSCQQLYNLVVPTATSARVTLCPDLRHSYVDGSFSNKAVLVKSSVNVSVIGYNSETFSADAFSVLPTSSLRLHYMVVTYAPTNIATQFGIVALENCVITINVPSGGNVILFEHDGRLYRNGDWLRFTLHANSTYLVYSVTDLSGMLISSTQPVAVFSGNARTYVDFSRGSRDHIIEQVVPASQLGHQFVFTSTPRVLQWDVVKVVSRFAGTTLTVYTGDPTGPAVHTFTRVGETYQRNFASGAHFVASQPVTVSVIVLSQNGAEQAVSDPSDPSLYFLPSVDQCSDERRIVPRFVYAVTDGIFDKSYVLITLPNGTQSGLRINNQPLPSATQWSSPSDSPLGYVSAAIALDPSLQQSVINHINSVPFCTVAYSASDRESAATVLGLKFARTCIDSPQKRGDGIDNDCDGRTDEESCDNLLDDDLDGLINEDCYAPQLYGDEYVVAFISNDIFDQINAFSQLELYMTPANDEDIDVIITSPKYLNTDTNLPIVDMTVQLMKGKVTKIELPPDFRLGDEGSFSYSQMSPKVALVQSLGKQLFYLYAIDKRTFSADSFLAYPLFAAGTTYYTVASAVNTPSEDQSVIGIVAHMDNTVVNVHLRNGVTIYPTDGDPITGPADYEIALMAYQGFELQSEQDLTGTRLTGSKPFTVYAGNIRVKIPATARSRDHLVEEMPTVKLLHGSYSSISTPRGSNAGDLWKVVATENNTVVQYQYMNLSTSMTASGNATLVLAGDFVVIDPGSACTIHIKEQNGKPLLVAQLMKSQLQGELTDPSLMTLPPLDLWSTHYTFATPRSGQIYNVTTQLPYYNFILVVVEKSHSSNLSLVGEDGVRHAIGMDADWYDVPGTQQQAAVISIVDGRNIVENTADGPFMLLIFGAQDRESYASVAGQAYDLLPKGCVVTASTPNDGVDNDCDSFIDEELIDDIDNDGDGLVDEDTHLLPVPLGDTYYVVYQENTVEYPKLYSLEMHVGAGEQDTACRVTTPSSITPSYLFPFSIAARTVKDLAFSPAMRVPGEGVFSNSFRIDCSLPVTIMAFNKDTYSADGFVAFHETKLGREYVVVAYPPEALAAQYAVLATEPGQTNVAVNGVPTVVLQQYEVFQAQTGVVTGLRVSADKRIAVYSGDVRTSVVQSRSRDHLAVQLPPVVSWGQRFNLVPTAARTALDVYIVAAGNAAATVTLCCIDSNNTPAPFTVLAGAAQQFTSSDYCILVSSQPVLVARVSPSHTLTESAGDPSMILVVPESQYGHGATLTTPVSTGGYSTLGADYSATLTVIIGRTRVSGLRLNGLPLPSSRTSVDFPCNSSYVALRTQVAGGLSTVYVTHVSSTAAFTVILDGNADRESYSITASQDLPSLP